ncbi:MAG: hypothetical protein AAF959_05040 [Cyanobacteria bacterium P01_D01_bin.56]
MRLSLKQSTIDRLQRFEQEYNTTDLNDLIHSVLTELTTLRGLASSGVCRYPFGSESAGSVLSESSESSESGSQQATASRITSNVDIEELSALLGND